MMQIFILYQFLTEIVHNQMTSEITNNNIIITVLYSSILALLFCSVIVSTFVASSRTRGSPVLLLKSSTACGPPSLKNIGMYLVAMIEEEGRERGVRERERERERER